MTSCLPVACPTCGDWTLQDLNDYHQGIPVVCDKCRSDR